MLNLLIVLLMTLNHHAGIGSRPPAGSAVRDSGIRLQFYDERDLPRPTPPRLTGESGARRSE